MLRFVSIDYSYSLRSGTYRYLHNSKEFPKLEWIGGRDLIQAPSYIYDK
jgi:hypothetical protein